MVYLLFVEMSKAVKNVHISDTVGAEICRKCGFLRLLG